MKEIIIGKQGNQPFKISADGVSRRHARLTIDNDGRWMLEDLDSTNGTYIYDNDRHCFEAIVKKVITHNTLIRLGNDDTIRCFQFKALQLVKDDPNDFHLEFQELRQAWDDVQERKTSIEKQITQMTFIPVLVSLFLIALTWLLPKSWSVDIRMNVMRAVMIVPSFISPIINSLGKKKLKQLNTEIKEIFVCPNPDCGLPLTETEIRRGQCFKCKKHI